MKMLKRWISVCLVILLLAGVAFDHSSLIGSTVEAAGLEETDGASTEETSDAPSLLSEGDESDTPAPEEQTVTNTDTETEEPVEKTETKQEESTEPEKQTVTNSDTETKAPAKKTETKQEESAEPEKQTVTNSDTETKAPVESQTSTSAPATPEKKQEAMKLDQEIKDGNGTVVFKVTADIKEDTFDANTDEVTMKVSAVDKDLEDSIKKLMEKNLAADKELGSYFLYKVEFQVNGKTVEPGKEVKITFEPKDYKIDDVKDATVFYYNEANSPAGNKEAEIKEIIQKQEKIEALQKAGQSIENIDKDYDLTEITLKADKTAEKIVTEGRRSTVYGCYLEDELDSLTYENDEVTITVSETEIGAIPDEAALKVVPILEDDKDTEDQYKEVEEQLQKKAAEDEKDVAGFLAYDITFVDKDGNEIEPNSEVKVTMEYKEPALPAEKSTKEVKDTKVSVLHFEEDKDGNVKEVVDMNEAGQLDALETGDEQQVEKVEIRTESFSTFTIYWTYNSDNLFQITAHYVYIDESGQQHEIPENLINKENITFNTNQSTIDLEGYVEKIEGYTYQRTTVDSVVGDEISTLTKKVEREWGTDHYRVYHNADADNAWLDRYKSWGSWQGKNSGYIYFVYTENTSGLTIEDNIIEKGTFDAVYTPENNETVTSYVWYKSNEENGNYTEVEKVNYEGGASNLSEDGSKLYPAYDEGARKWYKVEVTLSNGETVTSSPLQVPYYNELQNGSFENPIVPDNSSNLQYGNDEYMEAGGVWQSTGEVWNAYYPKDVAIEIVREGNNNGGDGAYSWNYDAEDPWSNATPYGSQFAELNCQEAGALYQDVLTIEGTPLNYWLSHRARGNNRNTTEFDTMYLVIMPTAEAIQNNLTTQENLRTYLSNKKIYINTQYNQMGENVYDLGDGILVVRVTSNDQAWHYVDGVNYLPTSSLTRFFFVAGRTAADGDSDTPTQGNFLDDVGFSQKLPDVSDEEFTLRISKNYKGLDSTGISTVSEKIKFKITATKSDGTDLTDEELIELFGVTEISKDTEGVIQTPNGGLVYTLANQKIGVGEQYTVTITETDAELDGYTLSSEVTTSITKNGEETTNNSSTFILTGKTIADVEFTNTYERSENKKINFTKYWDDANNKYSTRPESLTVTLKPTVTIDGKETDISEYLTESGVVLQKTLSGDTTALSWRTYWEVPVYYNHEGVKYKIDYSVEEGEVNSEYVYESSGLQTGTEYTSTFVDDVTKTDEADTQSSVSKTNRLKAASASATNASANARAGEDDLGAPEHNKYIEFNPSTGEYTLNLDVTGKKGDTTGADILFVIDKSGSMGSWPGTWNTDPDDYYNLLPTVKNLLTSNGGIIDQIFAAEDNVNSVAYVAFSDKDGTDSSQWYTKDNYKGSESGYWSTDGIKDEIDDLSASGGTNWTWAMEEASDLLAQRSASSNEKIVIFLSDGTPTFTMEEDWWGYDESGDGNNTKNSYYDDAAEVVNSSDSLSNAQFYSVYLVDDVRNGMSTFNEKLNNTSHSLVDGTDLQESLQEILNKIIPTYKDVEITDVLSEYVEFADEDPIITVTKTESGRTEKLDPTQYEATASGSTVNVKLLNGDSLEDGVTYTVSFNVVPSDKANTDYDPSKGYPHTGDAGTGSTSAGQEGFFSNDNENTNLSYSIDGVANSDDTVPYQKPVVQVTTHTLTYNKIWNHPSSVAEPTEAVTLTVTYSDGTKKDIELSSPEYTYTEIVPISKTVTSVEEKNGNPDYTPSYSITESGTNITVTNNYSKSTASSITVKKEWDDKGYESNRPESITVGLFQSENGGEAKQYQTAVLNSANNWTETWNNLPQKEGSGTNITTYTYAVREISTPTHYTSRIDYEYGEGEITATITNTYDENCEDENYYIANVLQKDKITLIKYWDDNSNSQRLRSDELFITVKDGSNNKVFKLDSSNGSGNVWTRTVTVLEKKAANYAASENLNNQYYSQTAANSGQSAGGWWFSFTNQIQSKTITVQKVWNDNNLQDRPTNISLMLQRRANSSNTWEDYRSITITSENADWTRTISGLPINYDYQIVEQNVAGGYTSKVTQDGDVFTVTNTLKWSLKKTDMPDSGDPIVLKGAVFDLKQNNTVIATGTSDENGIVNWTAAEGAKFDQNNLDGTYTLVETKAPDGYQILESATWTLEFKKGVFIKASGTGGYASYISLSSDKDNGAVVTLKNDKLYELPSTGGSGIYWYLFGGTLLMMAASLIVYKNKRREVLKRK